MRRSVLSSVRSPAGPRASTSLLRGVLTLAILAEALPLCPQPARAWDAELVCPMPEVQPLESLVDEGPTMCSADTLHLMRAPTFEDLGLLDDRESEQNAPEVAARALGRARELADAGHYDDALLNLRVVEATMPRIADYVALLRAELHVQAGDAVRAAEAYRSAFKSTKSLDLGARAQVGYVLSLLRAQDPKGPKELDALLLRYVELPEAPLVRFELGQYRERAGQLRAALVVYRTIDLTLPGYPVAERARERIAALRAAGRGHPALHPDRAAGTRRAHHSFWPRRAGAHHGRGAAGHALRQGTHSAPRRAGNSLGEQDR